jgi:hypothetical protein
MGLLLHRREEIAVSDTVDELVAQAINGGSGSHRDW